MLNYCDLVLFIAFLVLEGLCLIGATVLVSARSWGAAGVLVFWLIALANASIVGQWTVGLWLIILAHLVVTLLGALVGCLIARQLERFRKGPE